MRLSNVFSRRNRILIKELVKTDFKLKYQGSILGYLWSLIKPLMLFAVMYVIFVHFLRFTDGTKTFPLVLLLGMVMWSFFTEATTQGLNSIVGRGDILRKISFPKYVVVISATFSALINLALNLIVVIIFVIASGVKFHLNVLLLPLNILELYVFALALAFLLSAIFVKYRDVQHIWEVLLQVLFYGTPIIYPLSLIAERYGWAAKLLLLSPVAQSIQDMRYNLIAPETTITTWNGIGTWYISLIPIAIVVLITIIAVVYFNKSSKKFTEVM